MDNIFHINSNWSAPEALRNIADAIEQGEYEDNEATVIIGTDVFHVGQSDDAKAAENAVWNMTFGIHKLMNMAVKVGNDDG